MTDGMLPHFSSSFGQTSNTLVGCIAVKILARAPMKSSEGPTSSVDRVGGFTLKTTILLVEDSKIQRLTNERILHKAGYTVLNAGDGEEALQIARQRIPDVILLDMLLPKLGGREVMHALKAPPTTQIPILFLSSLSQANEERLRNEGAAGYFEKSRLVADGAQGEKALILLIENIVQKSRESQGIQATSASAG
jgi:CheY-like chemotaxis protein